MDAMQKSVSYSERLKNITDELLGFIGTNLPEQYEEYSEEIGKSVLALLSTGKPRVMVYGIYNSGKSTLINALMKQEVAEMADRPMTSAIQQFDKGEYTLIDSPGIDAPQEHEAITDSFLNQCHIILFVISSKGGFESKYNYKKMAELIQRDTPFIIVLNERGCAIDGEAIQRERQRLKAEQLSKAKKQPGVLDKLDKVIGYMIGPDSKGQADDKTSSVDRMSDADIRNMIKAKYEQELREIQYKIIENLQKVTGDKKITEKYDLVCVNAKKALMGILRDKPKLYEISKVGELDKSIKQKLQGGEALKILHVPIRSLKDSFAKVEQTVSLKMQDGSLESSSLKAGVLRKKVDNLKEEMRILIRAETGSRVQEIASFYVADNSENIENVMQNVMHEIVDRYEAKLSELVSYIRRNFNDIEGVPDMIDNSSNLNFNIPEKDYTGNQLTAFSPDDNEEHALVPEQEEFFLFKIFKSRAKREEEKRERMEREVELRNAQSERRMHEELRRQQEARQFAASDLFEIQEKLIAIVMDGINEKFNVVMEHIQEVNCQNEALRNEVRRQLAELGALRGELETIENEIA